MRVPVLCILSVPALILCSCSHSSETAHYPPGAYEIRGTMHYSRNLEGGCWFLLTADSTSYQPLGEKAADLRKDRADVDLVVRDPSSPNTFCMTGKPVEVLAVLDLRPPH